MSTALFGDPPVVGRPWPGLPVAGIQPEVAYKLLWLVEAGRVADRRLHRQRDGHVDTGNGHQPLHAVILKSRAGKIALDDLEGRCHGNFL